MLGRHPHCCLSLIWPRRYAQCPLCLLRLLPPYRYAVQAQAVGQLVAESWWLQRGTFLPDAPPEWVIQDMLRCGGVGVHGEEQWAGLLPQVGRKAGGGIVELLQRLRGVLFMGVGDGTQVWAFRVGPKELCWVGRCQQCLAAPPCAHAWLVCSSSCAYTCGGVEGGAEPGVGQHGKARRLWELEALLHNT